MKYMKIVKKILSWISLLFLSFSAVILTSSFLFKWNMREQKIIDLVKENDLSFLLVTKDGETTSLMEDTKAYLIRLGIPKEAIEAVVNSEPTKEFVGKYTYQIFKTILYQTGKLEITKEDIVLLVERNFPVIERTLKESGMSFQKEQKDVILHLISQHEDHIMDLFPTVNQLLRKIDEGTLYDEKINFLFYCFRVWTSKKMIWIFLILLFLNTLFLCLLNWKDKVTLIYIRTSLLFYSFFFIAIEILLGTVVKDFLMSEWQSANHFFNYFVNVISKNIWIFIFLGFLMALFVSSILRYWEKREKEKILMVSSNSIEND